ncbi:WD40-repeat-containing domain protein [Umbelopsis sp. PMI_123]|nr:WD40-repeat-containing domain protein [Umbelopsis sp. PMI_123]
MPVTTFTANVGIPVFALGFTAKNELVVGGGGGSGRTGVKNKIASYKVDVKRKEFREDAEFEFGSDEDAPMCLDVHPNKNACAVGVNGSDESVEAGESKNCRVFDLEAESFKFVESARTIKSKNVDDHQKVCRYSKDGKFLATGTTDGILTLLKYPSLEQAIPAIQFENEEILDVDFDFDNEKMLVVTAGILRLISLRGKSTGQELQTLQASSLDKKAKSEFRAVRYGNGVSSDHAFVALNSKARNKGTIIKLNSHTLDVVKTKKISNKPLTAFCVSKDGSIGSYASADLSIGVFDTINLQRLLQVKEAHSFSITGLAINHDRSLLISASAENKCRAVVLPQVYEPMAVEINPMVTVLLALVLVAIVILICSILQAYLYN